MSNPVPYRRPGPHPEAGLATNYTTAVVIIMARDVGTWPELLREATGYAYRHAACAAPPRSRLDSPRTALRNTIYKSSNTS